MRPFVIFIFVQIVTWFIHCFYRNTALLFAIDGPYIYYETLLPMAYTYFDHL